ncbi:hypothetical protein AB0M54_19275 [Actinoplanes sp. NPDC051470]|uniref:hypothetical protein n=1 Tax=Actinoplanes sp. NPDC051470 TaxID=3157224 RepID=UPI0034446146
MTISWGIRSMVATGATISVLLAPAAARAAAGATTVLVDVAADGTPGNGANTDWDIADNGRVVAFVSDSGNLVAGDTNATHDAFVRDLNAGTTTLVSGGRNGQPANGPVRDVAISGNGRYVAFTSDASNLVAGDTNGQRDVFVHDRRTGVTVRAGAGTGLQQSPSISDDGRYVTFIQADIPNGVRPQVYVRDLTAGVTRQVSVPFPDSEAAAFSAEISGDGAWVAFAATGDYVGDGGSASAVYLTSRATGGAIRVSPQTSDTAPFVDASAPSIDRAGSKVLYVSNARLDPSDSNGMDDLYLYDVAARTTTLVTANAARTGAGDSGTSGGALSADGRFAGFGSNASDLVRRDTNGFVSDAFLRNLGAGGTTLVSTDVSGAGANGPSYRAVPSADASRVLFASEATDLGPDPGDSRPHLYLRSTPFHR